MTSDTRLLRAALLALALLAVPLAAHAQGVVPNLTAVTTDDRQVAVAFAATRTRAHLDDAGAFATTMIQQYGLTGIANYDPTTEPNSILVCDAHITFDELITVYGITGDGQSEAASLCAALANDGIQVVWR